MSNQIRMTPETMRTRAGQYSTEASNVHNVITKMDSLLKLLKQEWEGAAAESYEARYTELKPSFQKAEALINEIASALTSTAKIVEDTDNSIAKQFKS